MPGSPLEAAVARVGERWALLVVNALLEGPRRFNDLLDAVPGIAPNVLTQRLRHLERVGVLVAKAYSQRPPRAVYELTASGRDLAGALGSLAAWGAGRGPAEPEEGFPRCPTCGQAVDDDAEDDEQPRFL